MYDDEEDLDIDIEIDDEDDFTETMLDEGLKIFKSVNKIFKKVKSRKKLAEDSDGGSNDIAKAAAILGVPKDATTEEIEAEHKFKIQAYHPDRFTDPKLKARAEKKLILINEAYDILTQNAE